MHPNATRRALYAALSTIALALLIPILGFGPLNPPAGAIAATGKPLAEVEPRTAINATNTPGDAATVFRITQPGSYYLTENFTGAPGRSGITIAASNVTLDCRGFAVTGVSGSNIGIAAVPLVSGVRIHDGRVSGWTGTGVDAGPASGTIVERMTAHGNGGFGIRSGINSLIRDCVANRNASFGIVGATSSVVENCVTTDNTATGIIVGGGCTVRGCMARACAGGGIQGTGSSLIAECSAVFNGDFGINAGSSSTVRNCISSDNAADQILVLAGCIVQANNCSLAGAGAGIHATGADNRIEGNLCVGNTRGVEVSSAGNIVMRNTCSGNGTNWLIAAGNAVAPIVATASNIAPISGDTYAGGLGSTDPNANFTH